MDAVIVVLLVLIGLTCGDDFVLGVCVCMLCTAVEGGVFGGNQEMARILVEWL